MGGIHNDYPNVFYAHDLSETKVNLIDKTFIEVNTPDLHEHHHKSVPQLWLALVNDCNYSNSHHDLVGVSPLGTLTSSGRSFPMVKR